MKLLSLLLFQVLLKYNTSEKRTCEDDALMFKIKTLLRWFLLTALLFFPFMLYVPFYFDDGDSKKPGNGKKIKINRIKNFFAFKSWYLLTIQTMKTI